MAENIVYTLTKAANPQATAVTGKVVFDATVIVAADYVEIDVGFKPSYVHWENATDRIALDFYEGMADESAIKTAAAGARTLEVTGGNKGVTLTTRGFRVAQSATLAAILASKTCYFRAEA